MYLLHNLGEFLQLCWYKAASMPSSSTAVQRIDLPRGAAQNRSAPCFLGSTTEQFLTVAHFVAEKNWSNTLALELAGSHASESKQELVKSCGLWGAVLYQTHFHPPSAEGSAVEHRIMWWVIRGPDFEWAASTTPAAGVHILHQPEQESDILQCEDDSFARGGY